MKVYIPFHVAFLCLCYVLIQNRYANQVVELGSKLEVCENSYRTAKAELKELKAREARIMTDFAELEEDNVVLQKQLMQSKQAQVMVEIESNELRYDLLLTVPNISC
jgi:protein bicaudal D